MVNWWAGFSCKSEVKRSQSKLEFVGEYLNGLKSGKGKEYDDNLGEVLFEGEYKNGFRKKGREYIHGKLEYVGEYLYNRKFNGKGYNENGNIIYELINGNGNVKEYRYDKLIFEGEYLNGERNRFGKEYKYDKLIFEGEYLNGKRWNGKGIEYARNCSIKFDGEYLNGKKWNGKLYKYDDFHNLIFKGEYLKGKLIELIWKYKIHFNF